MNTISAKQRIFRSLKALKKKEQKRVEIQKAEEQAALGIAQKKLFEAWARKEERWRVWASGLKPGDLVVFKRRFTDRRVCVLLEVGKEKPWNEYWTVLVPSSSGEDLPPRIVGEWIWGLCPLDWNEAEAEEETSR